MKSWREDIKSLSFGGGNWRWCVPTLLMMATATVLTLIARLWVTTYSPLPWHDEWEILSFLYDWSLGNASLWRWFDLHNEHRLFVPRLIFAADFWLFSGGSYFSFVASALALVGTALAFARAASWSAQSPSVTLTIALLAVLPLVNGQQASNYIWAFQVTWFTVHCLVTLSILSICLALAAENEQLSGRPTWLLAMACLAAIAANFCTASGNFVWIPLLIIAAWRPRRLPRGARFIILACGVASTATYFTGFQLSNTGSGSLAYVGQHPLDLILFFFALAGAPLVPFGPRVAIVAGAILVCVAAWALRRVFTHRDGNDDRLIAFTMGLLSFCFVAMASTAVGRVALGQEAALESRFASVAGLAWATVLMMLGTISTEPHRFLSLSTGESAAPRAQGARAGLAVIAIAVASAGFAWPPYDYSPIQSIKRTATAALLVGVDDAAALERVGFWHLGTQRRAEIREFLRRESKVFFAPAWSRLVGSSVHDAGFTIRRGCVGSVDVVEPLGRASGIESRTGTHVKGWAWNPSGVQPRGVLLINPAGIVIGAGLLGLERPDVKVWDKSILSTRAGWEGYVRAEKELFVAYAVLENEAALCECSGIVSTSDLRPMR